MRALESASRFIATMNYEEVPTPVRAQAKKAIVDCVGVMVAGLHEPGLVILRSFIEKMGGEQRCLLPGTAIRTSPAWAALYTGTMAHALDFDDGAGLYIPLHPTVPVLPSVMSLGQYLGASGARILEAYICGTEVECKLAKGSTRGSYDAGWHATGVFGTMGAAAGAARLAGLDAGQAGHALGIALSLASGSRQNFGTMVKPLHAGKAAMNGIIAAMLAQDGFTASEGALEGPFGFEKLFGGAQLVEECSKLGNPYHLATGVSIKKYPSCYATHSAIEATLQVVGSDRIDYRTIREITCRPYPSQIPGLPYRTPRTVLEGKFSIPFVLSVACIHGGVQLQHFADAVRNDARIVELCGKVVLGPDETLPHLGSRITVITTDGAFHENTVEWPPGHAVNPVTMEMVEEKFKSCASLFFSEKETGRCLEMLLHLETLGNLTPLMDVLSIERGTSHGC